VAAISNWYFSGFLFFALEVQKKSFPTNNQARDTNCYVAR
jgi:hypothetical protein